jgi:chaperonin cofactor prefoldin
MDLKERNQDRRSGDRLISLNRLCDFFIEEKKRNPHSEYAWNELRDEIFRLTNEIETIKKANKDLVVEANILKDEIKKALKKNDF